MDAFGLGNGIDQTFQTLAVVSAACIVQVGDPEDNLEDVLGIDGLVTLVVGGSLVFGTGVGIVFVLSVGVGVGIGVGVAFNTSTIEKLST